MELRQLRYFVAVAEELHFGRAAERLHIVQPTVSQQVRRLERELRLDLFDRTTRKVTLTAGGAAFLPHARAVLTAERAGLDAMADHRAERKAVLRIGTSVGLGTRLEHVLASLAESAPDVAVELTSSPTANRLQAVRDGELDAAFVRGASRGQGLDLVPVWKDPLVVALPAAHPLATGTAVQVADLAALPLRIVPREHNPHLVDLVVAACNDAGFEPLLGPAFTTDQDTLAAIATGAPSWTVFYAAQAARLPAGRTVFRPFAPPIPMAETFLAVHPATPARRLTPLLAACHGSEFARGGACVRDRTVGDHRA